MYVTRDAASNWPSRTVVGEHIGAAPQSVPSQEQYNLKDVARRRFRGSRANQAQGQVGRRVPSQNKDHQSRVNIEYQCNEQKRCDGEREGWNVTRMSSDRRDLALRSHVQSLHGQATYHCEKQRGGRLFCCGIGIIRKQNMGR